MLGEAGATVYCTGRSARSRHANARPETIEETAEMVDKFGGRGIAVRVDHTVESEVEALFRRVKNAEAGLDILVNDIWGADPLTQFGTPFWQLSMEQGFKMLRQALHSHIITSRYGAPLLMTRRGGLLIGITDGNSFVYRGNLFYDLVKTSVIRLAFVMARELRRKDITSLALTPGYLRSEAILEHFGVTEQNWRLAVQKDPNFAESETPFYIGRAVAALAADPLVFSKSGRVFSSWDLAVEYGFTDIDGRKPHWGNYFRENFDSDMVTCDEQFYKSWKGGPFDTLFADWP